MGISIRIASPALLFLHQKEVVKVDNTVNVLLIGKQIAENRLCSMPLPLGDGISLLIKKVRVSI